MEKNTPLLKPYFTEDELIEIKKVLDSGWVSQGPKVKEFEKKAKEYLGVKHAIAVTNCTAAIHLALLSIGVKEGDEVLVADYTYPATGHAVLYCRAKPVFIDVFEDTYNINPELIKEKITSKTKAIIPVHTFGQPAMMREIIDIASDYDIKVIEDAACAFGARYKNESAGTIGDIGCFSFHARKGITTGEGGMVVTNDSGLANQIRDLSVFGISSAWDREKKEAFSIPEFNKLGYNYKMSDITAAVGVAQLRKIEKIILRKRRLSRIWDNLLSDIDCITPPISSKDSMHIYQSYVAVLDEKIKRNNIIDKLRYLGVQSQIGTYASHIQPIYSSFDKCPISLKVFNTSLALPMFYSLTEKEIKIAVKKIDMCLKGYK